MTPQRMLIIALRTELKRAQTSVKVWQAFFFILSGIVLIREALS